jgi:exodeoxyribonuclease-3
MKIVTWNVNSIRSRIDRAVAWLEKQQPDVVLLQEIKATDDQFPFAPLEAAGYHVETYGQKTYNGVALLSRTPAANVIRGLGDGEEESEQARLIAGEVEGVKVVGVYVPNGQSVDSPKFPYKLRWLARLRAFLERHADPGDTLLVLGDFNIAPDERDLYDPEAYRGQVHFHPDEHAALAALRGWGLEDLFRQHEEAPGIYTWWDYRQLGFPKNRGLRIDLVLGTRAAAARCKGVLVDRNERKGKKPSDHAPVFTFLDEEPHLEA